MNLDIQINIKDQVVDQCNEVNTLAFSLTTNKILKDKPKNVGTLFKREKDMLYGSFAVLIISCHKIVRDEMFHSRHVICLPSTRTR